MRGLGRYSSGLAATGARFRDEPTIAAAVAAALPDRLASPDRGCHRRPETPFVPVDRSSGVLPWMTVLVLASSLMLLMPQSAWAAEPPAIARLFPPGGQAGAEVNVTLSGKPGDGNLQVWSAEQKLDFAFGDKPDQATIKIADDAEPSVHWLRFYNEYGATDLLPFFVGQIPEVIDAEPNNELDHAQQLDSIPVTINGVLHTNGEVDMFAIDLAPSQTLHAVVQANRELGSPMDGVLQILDPDGAVIASNDDDHGNDPLAVLQTHRPGKHFVRIFAFPAAPNSSVRLHGAATYVYRLTLTATAPSRVVDDEDQQTARTIPWSVAGRIQEPNETDRYRFDGTKGQSITVSVAARANFSLLDPVAVLKSEQGTVVKEFDDISGSDPDVRFSATLPEDARYLLEIRDRYGNGGERHDYVAEITENRPRFAASVTASSFVLAKEKPLEIPVTITREHGFAEQVLVSIKDLPAGVNAATVVSEQEGDTAKSVTVKIERSDDAKPFAGVFRIVCRPGESQSETAATVSLPNHSGHTDRLWLTVTP